MLPRPIGSVGRSYSTRLFQPRSGLPNTFQAYSGGEASIAWIGVTT